VRLLRLLVFTVGFVTLGVELSASRLLEPAFGNNQIVWAALIGLILLYLALGAWIGGRLADRYPNRRALDVTLTVAACGVALIPIISRPVLRMAATAMDSFAPGLLGGALAAVVVLFSVPVVLLGTASPWAVRLRLAESDAVGSTVGNLYALNTIGSLLGAFVPVLILIPAVGTRMTFFILSLLLLTVLTAGAIGRRHIWIPLTALLIVGALALWGARDRSIRAAWNDGGRGPIVFEDESLFNYIAVRQWGSERHLKLNDGVGIHSVYHPDSLLSQGIWDYFLLAPLFRTLEPGDSAAPDNLLVLGLAAGTVSGLFTELYGPLPITGVELDPEILEVGSRYFAMDRPNLTTVAADARQWLAQQPQDARWEMIAVDAYRPPYIPFHLTTVEFFQTVKEHLDANGVLAINVGRSATNYDLVEAMTASVGAVFPSVFLLDEPGPADQLGNTLLVATMQPTSLNEFAANAAGLVEDFPQEYRDFVGAAAAVARPAATTEMAPFTDDHAPVEWVVHRIIYDYLSGS
jgi:predicted membrane-bound spermidine synthase